MDLTIERNLQLIAKYISKKWISILITGDKEVDNYLQYKAMFEEMT